MAIKSFEVNGMGAEEFLRKITQELSSRELGKIVSLRKDASDLVVMFSKLGTSEIRYDIQAAEDGFKVSLKSEKIAFAHKPFRAEMEAKLASVLAKNGAKIS